MINWRTTIWLIILALLLSIAVYVIAPTSSAYAFDPNYGNIPYYVQQGDTVYVNETVDISGIMAGVLNLAYYGGYDEESGTQYLVNITGVGKAAYYRYYLNPDIFGNRLGKWYKWNGHIESNGNTLAFVVRPERSNVHLINETTNITLQNPNQTPIVFPIQPLLPIHHVSDYLIARGDGFNIPVTGPTNVWIFGVREGIYGYQSVNDTINLTENTINRLSPGEYTFLLQMPRNDTNDFMVRYNPITSSIDWFDAETFAVNHWSTIDKTPEGVLLKLQSIFPTTRDTFMLFHLAVEQPSISINQIDIMNSLNDTSSSDASISLESGSFLDVRGYTNVAPYSPIEVVIDPNFNVTEDVTWRNAIRTSAQGDIGGDMREFKVIIPVDKYGLSMGRHFVGARTPSIGDAVTTADFFIYGTPTGNYIPNKTIRYISGRYGPEELVPTPTPIIVEKIVTQVVTQIVTVKVTPSNEQVKAQQDIVTKEREWYWITTGVVYGGGFIVAVLVLRFVFRAYKRKGWMQK